ncbi:MAG: extracellular solute-binding protein, partial [Defluviitaleaceae bacterium]|nr:extracellular solute-binding protein [Defluviitaleaceae bacterium]
ALTTFALAACNSQETDPQTNAETAAPHANAPFTGHLTIATLFEDGFITAAARQFEALHDDVTIDIIVYDNWQTYAQIINTALMSGGGEDIISTRNLQWQRLADAGRLVDLTDKLTFAPGEFYQNVLDAYLYRGRRYVVPLTFGLPVIQIQDTVPENQRPSALTLQGMQDLRSAYPEATFMQSTFMLWGPTAFAYMFFELDFDRFVDMENRRADINHPDFIALLESVAALENLNPTEAGIPTWFQEDFLHSPAMTMSGIMDFADFIIATGHSGGGVFASTSSLPAINANSPNQALAAEFIQFLLSEDVQNSPEVFQTPVNRAAAVRRAHATVESMRNYSAYTGFTTGIDWDYNLDVFNRLADMVTSPGVQDPTISEFVRDEMTRFFDGEVTAQQAAANLQARITTYLNE